MKKLILLITISVLVGCATTEQVADTSTSKWSDTDNYPYSELGNLYESTLKVVTDNYFASSPQLDGTHGNALREYIRQTNQKENLLDNILVGGDMDMFRRANESKTYRETEAFQSNFVKAMTVSGRMMTMLMRGTCDIYAAKFIEMDPVKLALFDIVNDPSQDQFISWIYGEVSIDEAREELKEFPYGSDDKVYGFNAPVVAWKNLWGRRGYIIVRNGVILDAIVTEMN